MNAWLCYLNVIAHVHQTDSWLAGGCNCRGNVPLRMGCMIYAFEATLEFASIHICSAVKGRGPYWEDVVFSREIADCCRSIRAFCKAGISSSLHKLHCQSRLGSECNHAKSVGAF